MNLDHAQVYDIETFPNVFTAVFEELNTDRRIMYEISDYRDDRIYLLELMQHFARNQTPMIGFNNEHFDYKVLHLLFHNPHATVAELYQKAMSIINATKDEKFASTVWPSDRFAPQIDLFKIHHFDNVAKSTSLKYLQANMRLQSIVDMPVPVGTVLSHEQSEYYLKPYNVHDTSTTKTFAIHSMDAMKFRTSLVEEYGVQVMCWNDTKIGEEMIIKRLGNEVCFDYSTGRKQKRQTPRASIPLKDVIFPYVYFENPEFNKILSYLNSQTLKTAEIKELGKKETIKTKGVFKNLIATVGGVDFHYGVGGIHGSLKKQKVISSPDWLIVDVDVKSLYPSLAIVNKLAPEHLGARYCQVYSMLPAEREMWQAKKGKKCVEANSIKLGANGAYGKSNSPYSALYDPKYTMTVTVNGQLLLSMLIERLVEIPTLRIIQANTDGVTYYLHKDYKQMAASICAQWNQYTQLVLEDEDYNRMWIRDVNNYIAEDMDGNLKLKGAYWSPDPNNYFKSIAEAQPPAWHKDLSNCVSIRAAVDHMVNGTDIETYIRACRDPFDFACTIKTRKSDTLRWAGQETQGTCRYYVSTDGGELVKSAPPPKKYKLGAYKKAQKITDREYNRVMNEVNWAWDKRVCTKSQGVYEITHKKVVSGNLTTLINNMDAFRFENICYDWYVNEAHKLVIQ